MLQMPRRRTRDDELTIRYDDGDTSLQDEEAAAQVPLTHEVVPEGEIQAVADEAPHGAHRIRIVPPPRRLYSLRMRDRWFSDRPRWLYPTLLKSLSSLAGLTHGFDQGAILAATPFLVRYFEHQVKEGILKECLGAASLAGNALASLVSGRLADNFGRRGSLLGSFFLYIGGTIVMCISPQCMFGVCILTLGRFIMALGGAINSSIAPTYVAECAHHEKRGSFIGAYQLYYITGHIFSSIVNIFLVKTKKQWRWIVLVAITPPLLAAFALKLLPESPRYLLNKRKDFSAYRVMREIYPAETADHEIDFLNSEMEIPGNGSIFKDGNNAKAFAIGVFFSVLQPFVGVNAVMRNVQFISRLDTLQSKDTIAVTLSLLFLLLGTLGTILSNLFSDKYGRKRLVLVSLVVMLGCHSLAAFLSYKSRPEFRRTIVTSFTISVPFYSLGVGTLCWVINAEIYPLGVRSKCSSLAGGANWLANFAVNYMFRTLKDHIWISFTLFSGVELSSAFIIYFFVPDTKGIRLEDMKNICKLRLENKVG